MIHKFQGNCYVHNNSKKLWIEIPKNASKTISYHLYKSPNWRNGNYIKEGLYDYSHYAIIRDPIKRWERSTLEICMHYLHYTKYDYISFDRWFKAKDWKNFDKMGNIHYFKMDFYTHGLDNVKWISLDDANFEENVRSIFEIEEKLMKINSTEENEFKKSIENYINEILSDSEFIQKLKDYYADDYAILDSIYKNI
jgi:hypothetical protein